MTRQQLAIATLAVLLPVSSSMPSTARVTPTDVGGASVRVLGVGLDVSVCVKPEEPGPFPTVQSSLDRDTLHCACLGFWPFGLQLCTASTSQGQTQGAPEATAPSAPPDRERQSVTRPSPGVRR